LTTPTESIALRRACGGGVQSLHAATELLHVLHGRIHPTRRRMNPISDRIKAFPRCFQVATIVCHSNCRKDKLDLCLPDWVFQKIEAAAIRLQS
jgi:hypothetical protein